MKASHVKCLFIAFLLVSRGALSMISKNKRPYNPDVLQPPERLRKNVQDIAGDQLLSGARRAAQDHDPVHGAPLSDEGAVHAHVKPATSDIRMTGMICNRSECPQP